MNQDYIQADKWSLIEEGFDPKRVRSSESLFSLGNGIMGQRANFEEDYSGETFQGSYIGGIYYPDKTRVGWWKNGYPEYFAKVLNAPNWIGIHIKINGQVFDLNKCRKVEHYKRELNMKEGWHQRTFTAELPDGLEIKVKAKRFLSLKINELGAIHYEIMPINKEADIEYIPYVDAGITNQDSNWDDKFWEITGVETDHNQAFVHSHTLKTLFHVCTFMQADAYLNDKKIDLQPNAMEEDTKALLSFQQKVDKENNFSIVKYGGYTTSLNHSRNDLQDAASSVLEEASEYGFAQLLEEQRKSWENIWHMSDISIEGDIKAQQGIRFNIFQLNQTYTGEDDRLNIGPKGFTGEKYGGSTYWDTEAYCLPFYMATKDEDVARNLLKYRYDQLDKAVENAQKLGFKNGAALYPMVTMNGEESHNEWEITFEEIHRNGAIAYAIHNYIRFSNDYSYMVEMGMEVLVAIAKFWYQRVNYSKPKQAYVMLGVTGPNEYENNVHNNFYTNYIAKWCILYMIDHLDKIENQYADDHKRLIQKTGLSTSDIADMREVADNIYLPYSEEHEVYLQQDGFLDKEIIPVAELDSTNLPLNQNWSWDRILRSPYIKQADTLQGFYFFEDDFSLEEIERHYDFYEPLTVHESSLSPCVHSILACRLNRIEKAYELYLRTSRLDLDDYNKEVEEGCHITSMAGTWMSIVEGFGGFRIKKGKPNFTPKIPEQWESYSYKVNFRGSILKVITKHENTTIHLEGENEMKISVNGEKAVLKPNETKKFENV